MHHRRKVSECVELQLFNISEAKKTGMYEESITTKVMMEILDDEERLLDFEERCNASMREMEIFEQVQPALDSQMTQFREDFPILKGIVETNIKDSVEVLDKL